jgi:hypothetical protein
MTTAHPNDNEIQEYSLGNMSDMVIATHMDNCALCSAKAAQYRLIFAAVKQQPAPVFDFDVTALVMQQLPAAKTKHSSDRYPAYAIGGMVVFALAALIYLAKNYFTGIVNGLAPVLIGLIIITAVIITAFLLADMYKKFRAKMDALNFAR